MMFHDIAIKTNVSLHVLAIILAELKGLTAVGWHRFVSAIGPPAIANGTVMAPPRVASQRRAKHAMTRFSLSNTALTRKKKRREVEGMATAQQQPMIVGSMAHEETGATGESCVSRRLRGRVIRGLGLYHEIM